MPSNPTSPHSHSRLFTPHGPSPRPTPPSHDSSPVLPTLPRKAKPAIASGSGSKSANGSSGGSGSPSRSQNQKDGLANDRIGPIISNKIVQSPLSLRMSDTTSNTTAISATASPLSTISTPDLPSPVQYPPSTSISTRSSISTMTTMTSMTAATSAMSLGEGPGSPPSFVDSRKGSGSGCGGNVKRTSGGLIDLVGGGAADAAEEDREESGYEGGREEASASQGPEDITKRTRRRSSHKSLSGSRQPSSSHLRTTSAPNPPYHAPTISFPTSSSTSDSETDVDPSKCDIYGLAARYSSRRDGGFITPEGGYEEALARGDTEGFVGEEMIGEGEGESGTEGTMDGEGESLVECTGPDASVVGADGVKRESEQGHRSDLEQLNGPDPGIIDPSSESEVRETEDPNGFGKRREEKQQAKQSSENQDVSQDADGPNDAGADSNGTSGSATQVDETEFRERVSAEVGSRARVGSGSGYDEDDPVVPYTKSLWAYTKKLYIEARYQHEHLEDERAKGHKPGRSGIERMGRKNRDCRA